jgi:hypothetical protein
MKYQVSFVKPSFFAASLETRPILTTSLPLMFTISTLVARKMLLLACTWTSGHRTARLSI